MSGKKGMKTQPWSDERKAKHKLARWGKKEKTPLEDVKEMLVEKVEEVK